MDSGYSSGGAPFEYTVAEAKSAKLTFKRITLIALYALYVIGVLLAGATLKLILPMLALIPLSLWMIVFFTWRYTQVEYEYSFFAGMLTVSRVLGGRTKKKLAEITIRDVSAVYPCEEEYNARIEAFGGKTVFAASSENAAELYAVLYQNGRGEKCVLFIELIDKAMKIVRYYNASAVAVRKKEKE